MKNLIILLILFPSVVFGFEYRANVPFVSELGVVHELRVRYENVFIFGDTGEWNHLGGENRINTLGIGFNHYIEPFNVWIKGGRYFLDYDALLPWEAGYYCLNEKWSWIEGTKSFDRYTVEYDNGYTMSAGIDIEKSFGNVDVGLSLSYRWLNIPEFIQSYRGDKRCWIYEGNDDLSDFNGGVVIRVRF